MVIPNANRTYRSSLAVRSLMPIGDAMDFIRRITYAPSGRDLPRTLFQISQGGPPKKRMNISLRNIF